MFPLYPLNLSNIFAGFLIIANTALPGNCSRTYPVTFVDNELWCVHCISMLIYNLNRLKEQIIDKQNI